MPPGRKSTRTGLTGGARKPGRPRKHPVDEAPERVAAYLSPQLATRLRIYVARQRPHPSLSDVIAHAVEQFLDASE